MTVNFTETLGYAGYENGIRITDYFACKAEAKAHAERLVRRCEAETRRFSEDWYNATEDMRRQNEWLNSLMKNKNIRFKGSAERHFDRNLWNAYRMAEARRNRDL